MKQLFSRNLHLKVISFTLTLTLYSFVVAENEVSQTVEARLDIVDPPAEHVVLSELPDVSITLRGSRRSFARLDRDRLGRLPVDIDRPDQTRWEIRESDLPIPANIEVESIDPPWVALDIDQLVTQVVPIRENLRGSAARGFEIVSVDVEPSEIALTAPSSYFPEIDVAFTETINLANSSATIVQDVSLAFQRPFINYPDTPIEVRVRIEAEVAERSLDGVPLVTLNDADRCTVSTDALRVNVTGPRSIVEALDAQIIFAAVDCAAYTDLPAGTYAAQPVVRNLERSVEVLDTTPSEVLVTWSDDTDAGSEPEGSGAEAGPPQEDGE